MQYRTPSGYVELADHSRLFRRLVQTSRPVVDVAMPVIPPRQFASLKVSPEEMAVSDAWRRGPPAVRRRVRQTRVTVLSRRSLAPMVTSKLDPVVLLGGSLKTFRTHWWAKPAPSFGKNRDLEMWNHQQHRQEPQPYMDDDDDF